MGYILLQGGGEFQGRLESADRRAIVLAGGKQARIRIIPAAAAPDNNHHRAAANGVGWFSRLGARDVRALPLIDRESADSPAVFEALSQANLVFLLGGFPTYLADCLRNSKSWSVIETGLQNDALITGSSAGAMVLCRYYYDPELKEVRGGLDLVHNTCLVPHHDTWGSPWVQEIEAEIPNAWILGLDEETGILKELRGDMWQVYGAGTVTVYRKGRSKTFTPEQHFRLS